MAVRHAFQSGKSDGPDTSKVQASNWNADHAFSGGALGSILYRDTNASDGANWLANVATGQVLLSAGVGVAPVYGQIANAHVSATAAIAYSKLNLTGAVVDGDIVSLAASKLTGTIASGVQDAITRTGIVTSGTWSGSFGAVSGANLTTLTAANLSGTIASAVQDNITRLGTIATALVVNHAGPHAIGGATDSNRFVYLTGSFTGSAESIALGIGTTVTVPVSGDGSLLKLNGTVVSAASGTNGILCCLMVSPFFTGAGATVTGNYGVFIRQYTAATGAVVANGLAVDAPSGATRNYCAQFGGTVMLRGSAPIYFEQSEGTIDALIAGSTGADAYIAGSATGDLVVRASNHKILWSADGGTAHMILNTSGQLGIGVSPAVPLHVLTSSGTTSVRIGRSADLTAYTQFNVSSASRVQWLHQGAATGTATIDIDPNPQDAASDATVRFLRSTVTSGLAYLAVFKGDGTASQNSQLAGNTHSYLNAVAGNVGIGGITSPSGRLHIAAGSATASTAPIKLTSGALLTSAEAGAIEFLTDTFHATITTGAARKGIVLDDGARLTSGKIPIATTNGRLVDGQTPLSGTKVYWVSDTSGGAVNRKLTFTNGILTAEV